MSLFKIALLTLICGWAAVSFQEALGWPHASFYAISATLGFVFYLINVRLIGGYIGRHASEFASTDRVLPDVQAWELTARQGIVPKWVSLIGLASMGFFLAIPFGLIAWLFRTLDLT